MAVVRSQQGIKVDGLKDLRREIRRLDSEFGPEGTNALKAVNYKVADFVIGRAKLTANSQGPMIRRAAESMTPSRSGVAARINAGGRRAPFFGGAEFGAFRNQRRVIRSTSGGTSGSGVTTGWNQFRPWRGNGLAAGYFLYPTIRDDTRQIVDLYADEMDQAMRAVFPD